MDTTTYAEDAKRFFANVAGDIAASAALARILDEADDSGTLADWREADPETAAEADRLAEAIGFDLPDTDDYVWQAREALTVHLTETAGYGVDVHKVIRVTLAGGGPSGWIEFTLDGEDGSLIRTEIAFCDWFQEPIRTTLTREEGLAAYDRYQVDLLTECY